MSYSVKSVALTLCLILTLGTVGLAQKLMVGEFDPHDPSLLVADMERIPREIGSWKSDPAQKIESDPRIQDAADCLKRQYVNRKDRSVVTVMLSRGRPGPMVIKHLPTECYVSNGFEFEKQPKKVLIDRRGSDRGVDEFSVATFKKANEALPQTVRVYWSWSGDGTWQSPERTRMAFAAFRVLYKVYVIRGLNSEDQESDDSVVREFIRDLTQAMRVSLFAKGSA